MGGAAGVELGGRIPSERAVDEGPGKVGFEEVARILDLVDVEGEGFHGKRRTIEAAPREVNRFRGAGADEARAGIPASC